MTYTSVCSTYCIVYTANRQYDYVSFYISLFLYMKNMNRKADHLGLYKKVLFWIYLFNDHLYSWKFKLETLSEVVQVSKKWQHGGFSFFFKFKTFFFIRQTIFGQTDGKLLCILIQTVSIEEVYFDFKL